MRAEADDGAILAPGNVLCAAVDGCEHEQICTIIARWHGRNPDPERCETGCAAISRTALPVRRPINPFIFINRRDPIDRRTRRTGARHDALRFGTKIDKPGFNLFIVGPLEARMKGAIVALLKEIAGNGPRPSD